MCTGLPPQLQKQNHISEAEQRRLWDVMPLYLSDELRGDTIPWTEIQALHFPDRTAAWSKSPLRVQSLGRGLLCGGGSRSQQQPVGSATRRSRLLLRAITP